MIQSYYLGRMQAGLKEKIEAEILYAPWVKQGLSLEQIGCDFAIMQSVYNQLSLRERQVLLVIITFIGCEPFDWAKLQSLTASSMSGAEAKVGFLLLINKGLIYTFRKSWGELVYVMAHDSMSLWQRILWTDDSDIQVVVSETDADVWRIELTEEGGVGLADVIFQSMVYISQNELKLGKNGTLHKRQLQKWTQLLPIHEEWLKEVGIAYAYADVYPISIAIVLDVMTRLQIAEIGSEEFTLNQEAAKNWLLINETEQNKCMYALWKQVVFPAECWLQHSILLLERQPDEGWISLEGMMDWLRKHGITSKESIADDEARIKQLEGQWLLPLLAFGWMEKGICSNENGGSSFWYRWRKHPVAAFAVCVQSEGEGYFYVQPDFEVLVPPDTAFAIRWELSAIAEHRHTDHMSLYVISKASITKGMESGRGIDHMLEFLGRHAIYGIPDHVKLTLEQWAKPFGKVRVERVLLLRCEDKTIASTIGKLPGAAECLLESVGDQAWLVRAEQLKTLIALLDKAGWMTGKVAIRDGSDSLSKEGHQPLVMDTSHLTTSLEEAQKQQIAAKGFIYSRQPFIHIEMDRQLPVIEDVYPNVQDVPSAWMKEYRTYHPTTRKEIIETAIGWNTAIQIRVNGSDRRIVPSKIQETRGTWSVTGFEEPMYQEICLFPGEWQEMRIVLPGLYEKY